MTPEQFCFWLHGFFELTGETVNLTAAQSKMICEHLDLVFTKVTHSLDKERESGTAMNDDLVRGKFQKLLTDAAKKAQTPKRIC